LSLGLLGAGCNSPGGGNAGETTGAAPGATAQGGTLVIKGSDTLLQLTQAWVEAFEKQHPNVPISVTGGGSGTGITGLINGTADIANASREIEPKELQAAQAKGINPVENVVARDALSVIVHPENPVDTLTLDQVKEIYTGKVTNWNQVGGPDQKILLLSRETNSGTYDYFREHVLKEENFVPSTLLLPSTNQIVDTTAQDKGAIGYVGLGYLNPKVKPVKMKKDANSPAVDPTVDNVMNNSYPISRELYQYTKGTPAGHAKTWIDFVTSPAGQQIVRQKDFVPLQ
ncbi:MAG: PstS family phosphate ABC transporter substrate-binding protein, partial [Armatimonadetes bacterium]|nr:PstS family phosphate ABC transporter substrate-binding protein [Armatimonadota bacterium]